MMNDTFRYQHIHELQGFTIGETTSTQFSFQPHFHLDYHVGLVTQGVLHQSWQGQKHQLTLGSICFMPPDVVHSGTEQRDDTYRLTTFRISPDQLQNFFFKNQHNKVHQSLAPNVINNPLLTKKLLALKQVLQFSKDSLQQEELLTTSMAELLKVIEKKPLEEKNDRMNKSQLVKVRHYCEANLHDKITLDELATLSNLTRFQFIRRFQKEVGLAPHAWLMRLRLESACSRLTTSDAMIADIAADTGFYDQSHFNRVFKMAYQIAPSQYRSYKV